MMFLLHFSVALAASPTHAEIESAGWTKVTRAHHNDAGAIDISKVRLGEVDCYQGISAVDGVAVERLLHIVTDIVSAPAWLTSGVTEGRILARTGDHLEYYQHLDVPSWTFASDRHWFLQGDIDREGPGLAFRWDRLPTDRHATTRQSIEQARPGAVEPPINVGGWYFEARGDKVQVRYIICSDTGGSMPRMLQNAATRQAMPDTIGDLVREARRPVQ